jgi:hypothetical protein
MALGLLGVAGVVLWWLIHLVVKPALWGQPGTAAYETYEAYNQMWPLPLALMALGTPALPLLLAPLRRAARIGVGLLAIGLIATLVGNIAEFWLFTDQTYQSGAATGRNLSWGLFLIGLLVAMAGAVTLGLSVREGRPARRWVAALVAVVVPLTLLYPTSFG